MSTRFRSPTPALRRGLRALREADRADELAARVGELEAHLDHERLFPVHWVNRRVRDAVGDTVRTGPFAGFEYPDWAMTEVDLFSPKILGTYEVETMPALEALLALEPSTAINIGAAEGFYAVGLALRLPGAVVHAFEIDERLRSQLKAIAEHNGVADRIRIEGECTVDALRELVRPEPGTLIVSDCEGGELELLDPIAIPALTSSALLVETHDLLVKDATRVVADRFAPTHQIGHIEAIPRYVDDVPDIDFMPLVSQQLAISEFRRGPQAWLTLRPRG
jgi:hypothetical protein